MNIDVTEIIVVIIQIVFALIVAFVTKKVLPFLQEKGLYKYADMLVKCASTIYEEGAGKEKFDYAFKKLSESKYGKFFDSETIKAAIQSAYVEMCTQLAKDPSPMNKENMNGEEK